MKNCLDLMLRDESLSFMEEHLSLFKELSIDYVGYREFYQDGTSKAFCSNKNWYDINLPVDMSIHYFQELLNIKRSNHNYVLRTAYNTHNMFLQKLKESDMCNSLIIYKKENNIIKLFSFIAHLSNNKIMDSFINKRDLFKEITEYYNQGLEKIFQKKEYESLNKPLLGQEAAMNIFSDTIIKDTPIDANSVKESKFIYLGDKEKECLKYLKAGYPHKIIAHKVGISEKGVEYHFQHLRDKFKVSTRHQLIDLYNRSCNVLVKI